MTYSFSFSNVLFVGLDQYNGYQSESEFHKGSDAAGTVGHDGAVGDVAALDEMHATPGVPCNEGIPDGAALVDPDAAAQSSLVGGEEAAIRRTSIRARMG